MVNSLENIATLLAQTLTPFADVVGESDEEIAEFVEELGFELDTVPQAFKDLNAAATDLLDAIDELENSTLDFQEGLVEESDVLINVGILLGAIFALVHDIHALPGKLRSQLPTGYIAETQIDQKIEKRIYDFLVTDFVHDKFCLTYQILHVLGIFDYIEPEIGDDIDADLPDQEEDFPLPGPESIHWERLGQLFSDPAELLKDVYGWGTPDIDAEKLFFKIRGLSVALNAPVELRSPSQDFLDAIAPGASLPEGEEPDPQMVIPLFENEFISLAISVYPLPVVNEGDLQPIAISLVAGGMLSETIRLDDLWSIGIESSIDLTPGIALVIHPTNGVSIMTNTEGGGIPGLLVSGTALAKLIFGRGDEKTVLLSFSESSNLSVDQIFLGFGAGVTTGGDFDAKVEFGILGGNLKINFGEGDSFVSNTTGGSGLDADFDLIAGWSGSGGFYIRGSGGLEIFIPSHISLGPIEIRNLIASIKIGTGGSIPIELSTIFAAQLGPFQAVVERIGIKADFTLVGEGGNLGPLDLDFGFKPPNGIGLSIDASAVKGGGYLFFDHEKGEYAGVAELTIKETVSVKAIGILNTKLPDGRPGFAFLLIITAEFTPIQLGFGFTLNGVGGLIGINRGLFIDALAEGVRTGTIDNIMFPDDPVANAPQIIANMNAFFPIEVGTYTFGFMGIIGWGTPTLIRIELGLIIQVPDPVIFAILGVIKVALPTEEAAIVKLQVNFLGVIHFEERYMFFFAGLFGSKILTFTLTGEMYFSIDWSDNPNFVFSVGGFHPDYNPPALRGGIGQLERLTLNLLGGDNPRLTLSCYFAVTSNTIQFGASVDFLVKVWKVRVVGYLYFDALFQFNPFYFKISIGAGLAVMWGSRELFGIHLNGTLEGPTPWRIQGKASFRILFVKVKVRVNKTFGKEDNTVLPPVEIKPILLEALRDQRNWQAELPPASSLLVSLRQLAEEGEEAPLIAHPYGMLAVSQTKMPLGLDLEKMGTDRPSDYKAFRLIIQDSQEPSKVEDFFAPAQYINLSNEEKLSRKSFEKFTSGVRAMGDNGFKSFDYIEKCYEYERCIIDSRLEAALEEEEGSLYGEEDGHFDSFVNGGAVAKSAMGRAASTLLAVDENKKIQLGEESFVLVRAKDLLPLKKEGANIVFSTETEAYQKLKAMTKKCPELKGKVKVISEFELV